MINIDFVIGLPHTRRKHDSMWLIVDMLTKSDHFLPMKTTYTAEQYAELYVKEIVRLHGSLVSIIFDKGHRSQQGFGSLSKIDCGLSIPKLMDKQREQFIPLKICCGLAQLTLVEIGMNTYP